jgi:UDP-glucose 4-epimerase
MRILVTGGAGYIGSVVSEELALLGHTVVVLDNLQQGHRQAVLPEADFVVGDVGNPSDLEQLFGTRQIDAVMHLAADSLVESSMSEPGRFFRNNVVGGLNLLDAMVKHGVQKLVFSSSAATYGEPVRTPIQETDPKLPVNCYGETKLMFEKILTWYGRAHGLKHVSLRYFNAAGASVKMGEDHRRETHLVPNVLRAARDGSPIRVFGTDYPTRDGSCVRDYVHVIDIAQAHVSALRKLDELDGKAYNLGNSEGYSVLDVIAAARRVSGKQIRTEFSARRRGDPAVLLASSETARSDLEWKPNHPDIESIMESSWRWMDAHPKGYES